MKPRNKERRIEGNTRAHGHATVRHGRAAGPGSWHKVPVLDGMTVLLIFGTHGLSASRHGCASF